MASGIFFRNVPGARNLARWLLAPPRASRQKRGALGRGAFFPEVLWLCASGPRLRGPSGARISNLGALRPIVSEQGTSRFPFKSVPFWWTRAPFFDLLTPKEGRRVTRLFRPVEGVPSRQRFQFRLDRTLASRVHETARPNPFK